MKVTTIGDLDTVRKQAARKLFLREQSNSSVDGQCSGLESGAEKMQVLICGGTGCKASSSHLIAERITESLKEKGIADKHGKSVANVILKWLNQRNVAVIPKSINKARIVENFNSFDFTLSEEEMTLIASLDTGKSPIYDDQDLGVTKFIGLHKIHD